MHLSRGHPVQIDRVSGRFVHHAVATIQAGRSFDGMSLTSREDVSTNAHNSRDHFHPPPAAGRTDVQDAQAPSGVPFRFDDGVPCMQADSPAVRTRNTSMDLVW